MAVMMHVACRLGDASAAATLLATIGAAAFHPALLPATWRGCFVHCCRRCCCCCCCHRLLSRLRQAIRVTPVVRTVCLPLPLAPSDRVSCFDHAKLRDEVTNLVACFGWPAEWRPLLRKWFKPTWVYDCTPAVGLLRSCLCAGELQSCTCHECGLGCTHSLAADQPCGAGPCTPRWCDTAAPLQLCQHTHWASRQG